MALLAAAALTTLVALPFVTRAASERSFATFVGQHLAIPLEDGSTIILNTNSALTIRSEGDRLGVDLLAGEVLFNMRPNPHRHLTVLAGDLQIDDTATIFAVRRLNNQDTRVTVEEGQVELTAPQMAGVRLTANHRATLHHSRASLTLRIVGASPDEIQRQLAWRDGNVAFFGEKLAEVASELNRYNITQIEIPDPTLSQLPMGGSFSPTDLGAFIRTISTMDSTIVVEPSRRQDGTPTLILHHPVVAPHTVNSAPR
jgi:transmembrane sensor